MSTMRLRFAEFRGVEALRYRCYQHDRAGVIETLVEANVVHVKGGSLPPPVPVTAVTNKPKRKRTSALRLKLMPETVAPMQMSPFDPHILAGEGDMRLRKTRGGT